MQRFTSIICHINLTHLHLNIWIDCAIKVPKYLQKNALHFLFEIINYVLFILERKFSDSWERKLNVYVMLILERLSECIISIRSKARTNSGRRTFEYQKWALDLVCDLRHTLTGRSNLDNPKWLKMLCTISIRWKLNIDFWAQARRGLRLKICFDLNLNNWRILNNWIVYES